MKRSIAITVLILLVTVGPVWSADVTAALDMNSAYIWRGMTFNDGLVAQPSVDISHKGFGINVWGNMDIGDYDDRVTSGNFSEIDLTVSYGFSISKLEVGVGLIEYLFPTTAAGYEGLPGTREIYLSLGAPIVAGLSAGVVFYYDVDETHGFYTELSLGYDLEITAGLTIGAGAAVAYASEEFTGADAGLHHYTVSLSTGYAISDALSISAAINYVDNFDEDVLAEGPFGLDTQFYGGIGIAYAF